MPPTLRSAIRRKLLRWYQTNKRDLPWRRTQDPYFIWISETMLQQTQVATVIPYYEKFLRTFPDIDALARAPLPEVLRLWSGLGYYRRAENLRTAAQVIVRRHGGNIPRDLASLKALAGIGDYTAGALLSIAFGKPYPAVDGNVRRVVSRLCRIGDERKLRKVAAELVPNSRPGHFNQAIMELGATVCTPKNPRCVECPVSLLCLSRSRRGAASAIARAPVKFKNVVWPLAIVRRGEYILLRRRSAKGLLASLWELPGGESTEKIQPVALLRRHLNDLTPSLTRAKKLGEIRHAITHRRICAPVYLFDVRAAGYPRLPRSRWRWVSLSKLPRYATSSMTTKAVALSFSHEKNPH